MKKIGLYAVLLFVAFGVKAQVNPYGSLGIETKVLTLSDGKYEEFFDLDSIQQIGTILYNINTGKVVGEVVENEKYYIPKFSASRFISVDPLADMFPNQSPYLYAYNNPVRFIDVDGLYGDEGEATKQRQAAIDGGLNVGDVYQSGDEWGFNLINGKNSSTSFDRDFVGENEAYANHFNNTERGIQDPNGGAGMMQIFDPSILAMTFGMYTPTKLPITGGSQYLVQQELPLLRKAYEKAVSNLTKTGDDLLAQGNSPEHVARTLHGMRRELGKQYKDATPPELLNKIFDRNIARYGDKWGPSIDYLRDVKGYSWETIIQKATQTGGKDIKFR